MSAALSDARANERSASGAPQQAVVNGWVARDLLAAIALELGEARDEQNANANYEIEWAEALRRYDAKAAHEQDERVRRLLGLIVAAVAWTGGTLGWERRRAVLVPPVPPSTMPPPSGPPAFSGPPPLTAG